MLVRCNAASCLAILTAERLQCVRLNVCFYTILYKNLQNYGQKYTRSCYACQGVMALQHCGTIISNNTQPRRNPQSNRFGVEHGNGQFSATRCSTCVLVRWSATSLSRRAVTMMCRVWYYRAMEMLVQRAVNRKKEMPQVTQALVTLADNWRVQPLKQFCGGNYDLAANTWLPATIPGHWQHIPTLEQHSGKVVYCCQFPMPDTIADTRAALSHSATRMWLRINGIFYWSQPFLNATDLGRHEGYFEPYEHDVTSLLQADNTLFIEVECPDEHNKLNKRMITGVFSHWDCMDPHANPGGIWLPIELHTSGPVYLQSVRCHSEICNERFAQLRYTIDVDTTIAGPVLLRWQMTPRTFIGKTQTIEQRRMLKEGHQTIGGLLKVYEPRLWWTHDLGTPDLYTMTLEVVQNGVVSDSTHFDFGIRRFELRTWIPHLNGVRFLVKGNNYAPGDMRIATMNLERARQDVQLARECNMNLLRVHAHVDHPALYQAANEQGVLLWQDMPLHWLYRASLFYEAQRQTRAMVHLLYNHPSVGIWCMHNEPIFMADTADESLPTRARIYQSIFGFSWNRDVLDTTLKRVAEQEDPSRPVVRSSGEFDIPIVRPGTDAHAYFGWYASHGTLQRFETLSNLVPGNLRFLTEFGAQSFPNVESCIKFMPADRAHIDFAHLAKHHSFQPEIMGNWLPLDEARSLEELVAMSQDYQIFINRFYIDHLRYHKYRPTGGIVPFMFCDSYPAILWSVVDYWRVPKRSYYAMRLAFSPQYAFTRFLPKTYHVADRIELPIYVVNDAQHAVYDAHVHACMRGPDGTELATLAHTLSLEADCMAWEVDRLRFTPTQPGCYTFEIALTGVAQEVQHAYEIHVAR